MNILVKLKGNENYEPMQTKHVMQCLRCSFSCSFSLLESMLSKGFPIVDKFGNEFKLDSETPTPHIASRGGSNPTRQNKTQKGNLDSSVQISMMDKPISPVKENLSSIDSLNDLLERVITCRECGSVTTKWVVCDCSNGTGLCMDCSRRNENDC